MFYFLQISEKANLQNETFYKGKLFEELMKEYLQGVGYNIILRKKQNSLEYDIDGEHRVSKAKIIGEAKAHNSNIPGATFTSFIGKYLVLQKKNPSLQGLYLSTSALTSEANDFYSQMDEKNFSVYSGESLFNSVVDSLKLPKTDTLFSYIRQLKYLPQSKAILKTNNGIFVIVTASTTAKATPSYFALFNDTGNIITDETLLNQIILNISDFNEYSAINSKKNRGRQKKHISDTIITGSSWIDYKFPADPKFFVGREDVIKNIQAHFNKAEALNIVQIKSRSGVGKSSMLVYLKSVFEHKFEVGLHDARDIKSSSDFFSVIAKFTNNTAFPQDMRHVEEMIDTYAENLNKKAVFFVDQFEATFNNPEIFYLYETLMTFFLNHKKNLFFILARKDDLLTTYDDKKIDISRLNSISKHYNLKDFSPQEAILLINKINEDSSFKIGNEIQSFLVEFSQGFPWLLKRTAAHIYNLLRSGDSEKDLISTSLRLHDLFDEELEDLDESEREYLTKIASFLPATFIELDKEFKKDPLLTKTLDKLIKNRLLRLSGLTYDTYNDVFKEYLVFKKLPEFHQQTIYRISVSTVLPVIHWSISKGEFSLNEITNQFNFEKGSAYNQVKEMTNLNILERKKRKWIIKERIKDIYGQGRLGEYIRNELLSNRYISKLITVLNQEKNFHKDDLLDFIKQELPYLEASEDTWNVYNKSLLTWLKGTQLVTENTRGILRPVKTKTSKIVADLGNLSMRLFAQKNKPTGFTPQIDTSIVVDFLLNLTSHEFLISNIHQKLVYDLKKLGFIDVVKVKNKDAVAKLLPNTSALLTSSKKKFFIANTILNSADSGKIRDAYNLFKQNPKAEKKHHKIAFANMLAPIKSNIYRNKTFKILFDWSLFLFNNLPA